MVNKTVSLLRAAPHQWGQGHVHQIDPDRDLTLCGQSPARCPGDPFQGPVEAITCKACLRSIEARAKNAAWREQWQEDQELRAIERAESRRLWWERYNAYLSTQTWRDKRALVHRRAGGVCEGCGRERSTQVHHKQYPQGVWPGSPGWVSQEMLFHLIAICDECHERLHPDRWP